MASAGPATQQQHPRQPSSQQQQQQGNSTTNNAQSNKRPSRWIGSHSFGTNTTSSSNGVATQNNSSSTPHAKPSAPAATNSGPNPTVTASTTATTNSHAGNNGTNTSAASNTNNTNTSNGPPSPSFANIIALPNEVTIMHDRMLLLMANMIGQKVRCTCRSGIIYNGILSTINDADLSICLKLARQLMPVPAAANSGGQSQASSANGSNGTNSSTLSPESSSTIWGPPKNALLIAAKDVIDIYAENVNLDSVIASSRSTSPSIPSAAAAIAGGQSIMAALNGGGSNANSDSFRTDTDISANNTSRDQRELKRWGDNDAFDTSLEGGLEGGLGASSGPSSKGGKNGHAWDQFATNEKLFGTKTNYEEEFYTTKLDRSGADYQAREQRAAKLAKEILSGTALNSHVAEERGAAPIGDDSGMDEEDKYSGVQRSQNAYVPPGARRALGGGQPAPAPASIKAIPVQQKLSATPASFTPAANGTATAPTQPSAPTDGKDAQLAAPAAPTTTVTAATPNPAATGSAQVKEDLVGDFKKFVSNEKEKLTQKRSQLEKQTKDKRVAELKQFSQTFVLKMPVPADLVPILAKDENKQKEIANRKAAGPVAPDATAINAANTNAPKPASTHTSPNPQAGAIQPQGTPRLAAIAPVAPTTAKKASQWALPSIPPFDPAKAAAARAAKLAQASAVDTSKDAPSSSGGQASKFNVAAKEFIFRPTAGSFVPGGATPTQTPPTTSNAVPPSSITGKTSGTPAPAAALAPVPVPENPFFGTRIIRNNNSASFRVKEDFSPFKRNEKIADPSTVQPSWGFTGKTYKAAGSYSYPSSSTVIHAMSPQPSHALPAHLQHGGPSRNSHGIASPAVSASQISHMSRTSSSQGPSNIASTVATSGASSDDGGAGKSGIATPVPSSNASTSGGTGQPGPTHGQTQSGMQMHPQAMHMVAGQPQMIPQGFVLQNQPGQPYPTFRYAPGGAGVAQTPGQGHMQPGQAPHQAMVHQHQQQLQQLQQQMQGHQPQGSQATHIIVGPNGQPIQYTAHGQLVPMPFSPSMHAGTQPMFSPQMANQVPPGQHYMQPMFVAQPPGQRGQGPQMSHGQHPQHVFYPQMQASPGMHQQFLPMSQHQGMPMGASPAVYEQTGQ